MLKRLMAYIFWRWMVPVSKKLPDGKQRLEKYYKDFK